MICLLVMVFYLIMKVLGGRNIVTRKITRGSRINEGLEECIYLGNLNSLRDWGHARDYVEMQWRMLQQEKPNDYVIATGRQESVRKFVELSAKCLGWGNNNNGEGIIWKGEGVKEVGIRADTREIVVQIDPRYFRPCEVDTLLGNPLKASQELGWVANTTLEELVEEMISEDLSIAQKEVLIQSEGFTINSPKENPPSLKNKKFKI